MTPVAILRSPRTAVLLVALVAISLVACVTGAAGQEEQVPAEIVTAWNARILALAEEEDGFLTLKGVRTAAMAHLAMHDALAAIDARFRPYAGVEPRPGADPVTALNEAAYRITISQYPDVDDALSVERASWASPSASPQSASWGRSLGQAAAEVILRRRADDGWDSEPAYQWHPMGPGVYAEFREHSGTPEGFVFGAGWAETVPFMLSTPDKLRVAPPPEIESQRYVAAFREVKEVGRRDSETRTEDQSHLALWWKEFVESSHNRLGREMVVDEGLDAWQAARFFALLNMSIFDGYVAVFDSKFFHNHWRPYTAIRWAAEDGNPATIPDESWTNLHDHTYAFPSYPSAHGTVCAAAMTVFEDTFGADRPFEMTIREVDSAGPMSPKVAMDPPTRAFESFAAAAEECSFSRVYLGIHFRYDSEVGTELGRRVGEIAVDSFLRRKESGRR